MIHNKELTNNFTTKSGVKVVMHGKLNVEILAKKLLSIYYQEK